LQEVQSSSDSDTDDQEHIAKHYSSQNYPIYGLRRRGHKGHRRSNTVFVDSTDDDGSDSDDRPGNSNRHKSSVDLTSGSDSDSGNTLNTGKAPHMKTHSSGVFGKMGEKIDECADKVKTILYGPHIIDQHIALKLIARM
jgi:hypothetical protein